MLIKGIREHITNQLDTKVTVLRKYRESGFLEINETERENDGQGAHLETLIVTNIPNSNVWVFENEFDKLNFSSTLKDLKGAFTFAGKKVEKTIILQRNGKLYLLMIEMKRTISPKKYRTDIVKKYESSIESLSVFIAAHFEFTSFEDSKIFPVGICCYNYYQDSLNYDNDPQTIGGKFRNKYESGMREMTLEVEALLLNNMRIPIVLCSNPNNPLTTSFEIDFEEIIKKAESIATATISIPTKTLKDL